MLLAGFIFWELPLVSAVVGYGVGYVAPQFMLSKYYASFENSIIKALTLNIASETPKQLLGAFVKTSSPDKIEQWLSHWLGQVQHSLQSPATIRKLYRLGDDYIPMAFQQIGKQQLNNLDQAKRDKLAQWMSELYDQLFSQINLQYHQSEVLMDVVFGTFLTPAAIRQMLLESVAHAPTETLEKIIKQQLSGIAGMVIKFIDLKPVIERFKSTVIEEPQQFTRTVLQLLDQFEIREKLAERLTRFSWKDLPEQDRENIKHWINRFLEEWLQDDPDTLCQLLVNMGSGSSRLLMRGILQTDLLKMLTTVPQEVGSETSDKTALGTISVHLYDMLLQFSKKPPAWFTNITKTVPGFTEKILAAYPVEKRQALALQILQPMRKPVAICSAGAGAGYGLLSDLLLLLA